MRFGASIIAALSFAWPTFAFLRTVDNVQPFSLPFPQYSGVLNISTCIAHNEPGVKSYWFINFLHGSDGCDYYIVFVNDNVGLPNITNTEVLTSVSMHNITSGQFYGETFISLGNFSNTTLSTATKQLSIRASSPDQFSTIQASSTLPNATFNLTINARGPNLYQGGGGSYTWGTGLAYAIDNPEAIPNGTITLNGKTISVVPDQSVSWFDTQWGPGYAPNGWYSFVLLMNDGTKIVTMTTGALTNPQAAALGLAQGFTDSIVTFLYPNGHHEVYIMDPHVIASGPWNSTITGFTYYSNYTINIPGKGTLNMTLPAHSGELADRASLTTNTVNDAYCTVVGVLDGEPIKGFGNCERAVASPAQGAGI